MSAEEIMLAHGLDPRTATEYQVAALGHFLRAKAAARGQHIRLVGGATICPTCAAWRRWYVAHRIASGYLREVGR